LQSPATAPKIGSDPTDDLKIGIWFYT